MTNAPIQWDWTFSAGNIAVLIAVVGGLWRVDSLLRRLLMEHELLMREFCERQGIKLGQLPTRMGIGKANDR